MFGMGFPELVLVLVIVLIVFGPGRLPQIGSGLGKAIRDFKRGIRGDDSKAVAKGEKNSEKAEPRGPRD